MAPAEVDFRRVARAGRQDGAEVHARGVGGGGASGGALRSVRGREGDVWGEGVGGAGVEFRACAAAGAEVGRGGAGGEVVGGVGGGGEGEEGEGEEGEGEEVHGSCLG